MTLVQEKREGAISAGVGASVGDSDRLVPEKFAGIRGDEGGFTPELSLGGGEVDAGADPILSGFVEGVEFYEVDGAGDGLARGEGEGRKGEFGFAGGDKIAADGLDLEEAPRAVARVVFENDFATREVLDGKRG